MNSIGVLLILIGFWILPVQGQDIVITKGFVEKISLDLSGIQATGGEPASQFVRVLQDDLKRSGWFEFRPSGQDAYRVSGT